MKPKFSHADRLVKPNGADKSNSRFPPSEDRFTLTQDMSLIFEEYVFDPRPQFPFLITMKRYPNSDDEQNGFTLILAHGTGFHKELWEPIIKRIFSENTKSGGLRIRDAWAIDAPNHGDAATLNATLLKTGAYDSTCEPFRRWPSRRPPGVNIELWDKVSWENYSRAINLVLAGLGILTDGRNRRTKPDFKSMRLIGIGHSMGAVSLWVCSQEAAIEVFG